MSVFLLPRILCLANTVHQFVPLALLLTAFTLLENGTNAKFWWNGCEMGIRSPRHKAQQQQQARSIVTDMHYVSLAEQTRLADWVITTNTHIKKNPLRIWMYLLRIVCVERSEITHCDDVILSERPQNKNQHITHTQNTHTHAK